MGQPDRGRHHKNDRGHQAWHHADAKKYNRRYQVNECRQCLHQIQNRTHGAVQRRPMGGCDTNRNADGHADHTGRKNQGKALGGFFPVILIENEQKSEQNKQAGFPGTLQIPGQSDKESNDEKRMRCLQHPKYAVNQGFQTDCKSVEEPGRIGLKPVEH